MYLTSVHALRFKNIIVLFNGNCPDGWTQLTFNNEFIRIAGGNIQVGSKGGSNIIKIYVKNLPPHKHNTGGAMWYHKYGGG